MRRTKPKPNRNVYRNPNRRRPGSLELILRGRDDGQHYHGDEILAHGGKAILHRKVRQHQRTALRRQLLMRP